MVILRAVVSGVVGFYHIILQVISYYFKVSLLVNFFLLLVPPVERLNLPAYNDVLYVHESDATGLFSQLMKVYIFSELMNRNVICDITNFMDFNLIIRLFLFLYMRPFLDIYASTRAKVFFKIVLFFFSL